MSNVFEQLSAPFNPNDVSWRVGPTNKEKTKGMALAFLNARDVMARLDAVCGPAGWQNRYSMDGKKTVCEIGIKCGDEWIWKADGAGDSDMEAEKGALSDAFKRAAVRWGIGRYLYETNTPWVEIEARGNSYFIPDRELRRLAGLLGAKPVVPADIDERRPTQQGRKNEEKGLIEAREWVNAEALPSLAKMKVRLDLNKWLGENTKRLDDLKAAFPEQFEALDARINKTMDRLMALAAG